MLDQDVGTDGDVMALELKRHSGVRSGSGTKPEDFGDNFFISEIETQCWFVEGSFAHMQSVFAEAPTSVGLQAIAHSILVFASNVAKLLSEPKKGSENRKRRAIRLQQLLNCTEYDFSATVAARNYLEHFDERMDRYLDRSKQDEPGMLAHRLVHAEIDEFMTLEGWGTLKARYLQHLNTTTLEFTMVDKKILLGPVIQQSMEIGAKAKAWREALPKASG